MNLMAIRMAHDGDCLVQSLELILEGDEDQHTVMKKQDM
jgi:hypothetical protein